ncbi:immunity 49 family protein [Streptomyces mesophilus]|uniref:immunity 49 family protein n=1 Tax=Streptomyces mesophilus TaxID=1775132 RepID=UPI00332C860F
MVTSVSRHDFRTDNAAEAMAPIVRSAVRAVERMEGSEISRSRALTATLTAAKWHCVADPDAAKIDTWYAWVQAMQVGSALFTSATATEGPVACRIGVQGEVKNLPATGPVSYTNAGAWVTSFYLALILRENERLERLARVPVSFLRESGAAFDEYIYSWVETLQSFWLGRDDIAAKLVAAVDGTAPDAAQVADSDMMLKVLYPPIELFHRYLRGDTEQFNKALAMALNWHKEYWTADEARALSGTGLVALGPLAMACIARDAGMQVEVESPYLPAELLRFARAGEIAT